MNSRTKGFILKTLGAFLVVIIGAVGWTGFKAWRAWNALDQGEYNLPETKEELATIQATIPPPAPAAVDAPPPERLPPPAVPQDDDEFDAFLAVGSDNRPGFGGNRADVILLVLVPRDDRPPLMVSLPRDLYIESPCTLTFNRINVNLNGCRADGVEVTGPELLAIAVEDYTGVEVDHFALFGFDGFERVINKVGGVEICVDHPVRDADAELALPAGCTNATGAQALGWVRSRKTQELVDGQWRTMRGVSDLSRNERQQDVLLQMLQKLKKFRSVGDLLDTLSALADAFTVDEGLSVREAAELAWSQRSLDAEDILRIRIPVENYTTSGGAAVLLPQVSFTDLLTEAYGTASTASG
jgi:LCP family protein required for cell wall assembly